MSQSNRRKRRRRSNKSIQQRLKQMNAKLLQRIGAITAFLIIFFILLVVLITLIMQASRGIYDTYVTDTQLQAEREAFIETLVPTAQRIQREYGLLASVSIGQASLESNYGSSELGKLYHNLYGVKTSDDDPNGVNLTTSEYFDDEWVEIIDRFKVYDSWDESMTEHAYLLYHGPTWNPTLYHDVLAGETYQEQAQALQDAGYATDPTYTDKVISIIEAWELWQYDQPITTPE